MEFTLAVALGIGVLALLCEYTDATLGMGYGTTMAPLLLLLGYTPLQIVPAILLSELVCGFMAAFFHSREGNVKFSVTKKSFNEIVGDLKSLGLRETLRRDISLSLRVALLLVSGSVIGTTVSVLTATAIPRMWVELYIGFIVLSMGLIIITCFNRKFSFSWLKIVSLGTIASFNKGLTGGGYGPLIVSGQMLSGIEAKNAIGITALSEATTCILGVILYAFFSGKPIDWTLALIIIPGAMIATPLSARSVKMITPKALKLTVAFLTITLGIVTLIKTFKTYNLFTW